MLLGLDFLFLLLAGWLLFYGAMGRKKSTNIYGGAKVGVGGWGGEGEGVITGGGGSVHGIFVFYHWGGGGGGRVCNLCVCLSYM